MMKDFIKNTVLRPLLDRVGTMGAVWLVAQGDMLCALYNACQLIGASQAQTIMEGVTIGALVAFDWVAIQVQRNLGWRK